MPVQVHSVPREDVGDGREFTRGIQVFRRAPEVAPRVAVFLRAVEAARRGPPRFAPVKPPLTRIAAEDGDGPLEFRVDLFGLRRESFEVLDAGSLTYPLTRVFASTKESRLFARLNEACRLRYTRAIYTVRHW